MKPFKYVSKETTIGLVVISLMIAIIAIVKEKKDLLLLVIPVTLYITIYNDTKEKKQQWAKERIKKQQPNWIYDNENGVYYSINKGYMSIADREDIETATIIDFDPRWDDYASVVEKLRDKTGQNGNKHI